jgi:hypothetical protein
MITSYNIGVDVSQVEKLYSAEKRRARENMRRLTDKMARNVPRMVGKRVAERYNIAASEVYPPEFKVKTDRKTKAKRRVKKAARLTVRGDNLGNLNFYWEARRLTVQRFKMKPGSVPTKQGAPYNITFSVLRGSRQNVADEYAHGQNMRFFIQELKGVTQALVAIEGRRKIAGVAKTLSVPVMIDNQEVNANIYRDINSAMMDEIKKLYNK